MMHVQEGGTPQIELPARVLLCLAPRCYGEFFLPLGWDEAPVCPNNQTHDVAVFSGFTLYRYCDQCGTELGLARAGRNICAACEGVDG